MENDIKTNKVEYVLKKHSPAGDFVANNASNTPLKPNPPGDTISASLEAKSDNIKSDKKARIIKYIVDLMNTLDPTKENGDRYKHMLSKMSDKEFAQFIEYIRTKKTTIHIIMPNMKKHLRLANILQAVKLTNHKLMHKLWLYDTSTGRKYLTNEEYMVVKLPIRRAQQELDKKLSVPSRDQKIDTLTGQVTGDDRACAISAPESQALNSRRLENIITELIKVRGGDIHAYGDFKRQLEDTGEASLESLDPRTRTRSSVVAGVLLNAMLLEHNL